MNKTCNQDKDVLELKNYLKSHEFSVHNEYAELWEMFHKIVTTSTWGSSQYGGPIWIMDFSLDNLKKFFPDSVWLELMYLEREQGFYGKTLAVSTTLRRFSNWFSIRAHRFILTQGLGNVLVKEESGISGNLSFYSSAAFLSFVQRFIEGSLNEPSMDTMMWQHFSPSEINIVREKNFLTNLDGGFVDKYPCFCGHGKHYYTMSQKYGQCYEILHPSQTKGFVASENVPEKFLTILVYDLMESIAQLNDDPEDYVYICPYPLLKYSEYLDRNIGEYDRHFCKTKDVFKYQGQEEIKIELPDQQGWWHRNFMPKQNWITVHCD
ncbi:MAG: hypothetical protein J6Y53_04640 [Alphaproteobacteria bacterium]|nr:hypothetical protein [Alphaproteobacteria bacterium]